MLKSLIATLVIFSSLNLFAAPTCQERWKDLQVTETYQNALNLCDQDLREELYVITSANHVAVSYKDARTYLTGQLDNIDGKVCSVYSPKECLYKKLLTKNNGFNMNIEHTWPQSLGAKVMPAVSDLNHLYMTTKETNSQRGNLPFCEVEVIDWEHGGSKKGIDQFSQDCFEPQDLHKGNVARALFYFAVRYGYFLDDEQERVARKWHQQDPVDQHDRERNQMVFEIQGNRNPFIDHPELVDLIDNF